jgi:hypothetical protein
MSLQKKLMFDVYRLTGEVSVEEPNIEEITSIVEDMYRKVNDLWPNLAQEIQNETAESEDEDEDEEDDED